MKKINLVVVEGTHEFGGINNLQYEDSPTHSKSFKVAVEEF